MKIIIVGAGVAGRALWRFLELQGGHDIEIYDIENKTRCGLHPCAWGVKTSDFIEMHEYLELPVNTILNKFTQLNLDRDIIKCELCTINKPQFLEQMCSRSNIITGFNIDQEVDEDTLVVDATGEARALLPSIKNDMKITCHQALYQSDKKDLDIAMYHSGAVGYAWSFPLDNGLVHIGQGSFDWTEYDRQVAKRSKSDLKYFPPETRKAMFDAGVLYAGIETPPSSCKCKESQIRLLSPKYCQPFTSVYSGVITVGVGESIGCVHPGSGAGIIPSLICAAILADHVRGADKYRMLSFIENYTQAVLNRFSYLDRETNIIKKLLAKIPLNILDLLCLYRNNRKFGIYPGPRQIVRALKRTGAKF